MTTSIQIHPNHIEFEGFYYLEFEGEFYKGCRRCGGDGHYAFNGEHNRCYECDNTSAKLGEKLADEAAAQKWCHVRALAKANRERKAEAKRLATIATMEAKQAALKLYYPEVFEFLMSIELGDNSPFQTYEEWATAEQDGTNPKVERNSFIRAMAETLRFAANAEKPFSQKMIDAITKSMNDRNAKAAADDAKAPVVEGRRVVSGKVISTKAVDGDYGTSYKMLVEEEGGARVYGSIASSLWDEVEFLGGYRKLAWNETDGVMKKLVGMEVVFTATVEVSNNDKSFGFFKRPTKASIVA